MAQRTTNPVIISLGEKPSSGSGGAVMLVFILLVVVLITPFVVFMAAPCWLHDNAPKVFDALKKAAIKIKLKDEGYSIDEEDCDAE
jgi:hypothetical protein